MNRGRLRRERGFNCDMLNLYSGYSANIKIKFRSFSGPYVMHCHAIEHEDMRMMITHDPTPIEGDLSALDSAPPLDGETRIAARQSGMVPDCLDLEHDERIYFDVAGNVKRLEDRGVGFPHCEFDIDARGNRG